jgi:hypothetical protein
VGLLLAGCGLLLFARAPTLGNVWIDVVPAMALLGIGAGIAFNPLLLAAMNDVPAADSGLASGMVNTSFMMGGALGLAVLASLAARQTQQAGALLAPIDALNAGYHTAFAVGACFAIAAAVIALVMFRRATVSAAAQAGGGHGM